MVKKHKNLNKRRYRIPGIVHVLLSEDYAIFFGSVVLGVICDNIFTFIKFKGVIYQDVGVILILIGTMIIYWSQATSRRTSKIDPMKRDMSFFYTGPYKYTRNPTNFGLTLTILGFGLMINSFFSILFVLIVYFISKLIFIKSQDSILAERYGKIFLDYKKKVKNWL
jgi:protein-S-isoprenylcysteine O-methyltransferase Ste14